MEFEWDDRKAASNLAKHGVPFDVAIRVFRDPNRIVFDVSREVDGETRMKCIGLVGNRLFAVVFHPRDPIYRIISARPTNKQEEKLYDYRS